MNASEELQKKRLMERNKISAKEALQRISAQIPIEKKITQAHFVIDNNGDLKSTKAQVTEVFQKLNS